MSRASFSTCSTSRLDTSGIDRYSDKDFNELHTFEMNDNNITPYKKNVCEKENNCLTANLSSSIEKWENIPKSTLNEYDGNGRLIDDHSELLGCSKEEHSSAQSSGGDNEVEQGRRENRMQCNTVSGGDANSSANNHNKINEINYDNIDYCGGKRDKNKIYYCKKELNRYENNDNDNNDNIDNRNNNAKSDMNCNNKIPENNFISTDFTANGIIRPAYISENDNINIINLDSIGAKMKIDGIIIGDYDDSKEDNHNHNNAKNNNNNADNNIENNSSSNNNCNNVIHYDDNINNDNDNNCNNDNINDSLNDDDDDDDDDENAWTSMPSSHDLTTTLETILHKEIKDSNENNENTTSKVSKKKKAEKIRNKKNTVQNENKNKNEKRNENRTPSHKMKVKNINIDERTYDLYSDGTHSKILAYRFERVLLVETFKENAGN